MLGAGASGGSGAAGAGAGDAAVGADAAGAAGAEVAVDAVVAAAVVSSAGSMAEQTRQGSADLRALLKVLCLKESDVIAELSKKHQELLHLGGEATAIVGVGDSDGDEEGLLGTGAGEEGSMIRRCV